MAQVLLFHHALGLTDGCRSLAARLAAGGHDIHTPDLYEGNLFSELSDGVGYAEQIGFDTITERGRQAADRLPAQIAYLGLSLGVLPAQMLAQTRPGARGAVLVSGAVPPSEFGRTWPSEVQLQIHMMETDQVVLEDGDLEVARELANTVEATELYLYPGDRHLFFDATLPEYDQSATELVIQRVAAFLGAVV